MLKAVGQCGDSLTWKSFRAGKATCMASQGCSLGEILTAGEWKSKAFLNYVDESTIDSARLLKESVESDGEEEELPLL